MALYIPHSIFHLARLLYVRHGNFGPYYIHFGTTYRSHPRGLRIGPIGYTETSVRNHHYSLRNNPEESSSQLPRGGSFKSRKCGFVTKVKDWGVKEEKDLSISEVLVSCCCFRT